MHPHFSSEKIMQHHCSFDYKIGVVWFYRKWPMKKTESGCHDSKSIFDDSSRPRQSIVEDSAIFRKIASGVWPHEVWG